MGLGHLLVCKSKNFGSWVYQLMIRFIVLSSFLLQDYISFIFSLVFFFVVFSFGVVVCLLKLRVSEVHLFYNLQIFYWHFLEILWLFIFLVFYKLCLEILVLQYLSSNLWKYLPH